MTIEINETPRYPGYAIRIVYLRRGEETGDVRLEWYSDESYRVAAFVPGRMTCVTEGDTPKMEPEWHEWVGSLTMAEHEFYYRIARCKADGWIDAEEVRFIVPTYAPGPARRRGATE